MPRPRIRPFPEDYAHPGSEITGDTLEFVLAVYAYQKRYRRRFPSWSEVLHVARSLGYRKVADLELETSTLSEPTP